MAEQCPLENYLVASRLGYNLHSICMKQCLNIWETKGAIEPYDHYGTSEIDCLSDTENSHEVIYKTDEDGGRRYVSVDMCAEHGEEVGEERTSFVRPYAIIRTVSER